MIIASANFNERITTWPITARYLHCLLFCCVLTLINIGNIAPKRSLSAIIPSFKSQYEENVLYKPSLYELQSINTLTHLHIIIICISILLSITTLLLGYCTSFSTKNVRKLLSAASSLKKNNQHRKENVLFVHFNENHHYFVKLLHEAGHKGLLFCAGFSKSLGLSLVYLGFLGIQKLTLFQYTVILIEAFQLPLVYSFRYVSQNKAVTCIFQGLAFGFLISAVLSVDNICINTNIKNIIVPNITSYIDCYSLALRQINLLKTLEKHDVTLFCRSDQLLCKLQKKILGITEDYDTPNSCQCPFRKLQTTHTITDASSFSYNITTASSLMINSTDYLTQWHIDILQATYSISRDAAEEIAIQMDEYATLPPTDDALNGFGKHNTNINAFLEQEEKRLTLIAQVPFNETKLHNTVSSGTNKLYKIFCEELVHDSLFNDSFIQTSKYQKSPAQLFTYVDRRNYRRPLSKETTTIQPIDRFGLHRNLLINCAFQYHSDDRGFETSCSYGRGNEFEFLMAMSIGSSPLWNFPLFNATYSGLLELAQLESIVTLF